METFPQSTPQDSTTLSVNEALVIKTIMDQFFDGSHIVGQIASSFRFPHDYLTFDTETSGFATNNDWITEVGWAVVRNRRIVDSAALILDWTRRPEVDQLLLRSKLEGLQRIFEEQGRVYHISYEKMRDEGVDPVEGLRVLATLLFQAIQAQEMIIGHGVRFDRRMLDSHFEEYLQFVLPWDSGPWFDTGLVEKAVQMNRPPVAGETMLEWLDRVNRAGGRAKWNLDRHCASKYQLEGRFGAVMKKAHGASYDSQLVYALFETYTQIAEAAHGQIPHDKGSAGLFAGDTANPAETQARAGFGSR